MRKSGRDSQRIIRRPAIHDDMLDIRVILPPDGLESISHRSGAVIGGSDDGYLHITG
jgi:hypothetical protein